MIMSTPVDPGPKGREQGLKVNLTQIRGSHTLRGGLDFRQHYRTQIQNGGFTSGSFAFSNAFVRKDEDGFTPAASVGLDWAAFILGMPNEMVVDTNDTYALFSPYYAGFAQDTWRVNRNLTLTLGLRMEYERGATERYDRALSYFDPDPRAADLRRRPGGLRAQSDPRAAGQRLRRARRAGLCRTATAHRVSSGRAS